MESSVIFERRSAASLSITALHPRVAPSNVSGAQFSVLVNELHTSVPSAAPIGFPYFIPIVNTKPAAGVNCVEYE